LILKEKGTNKYVILENKTTSFTNLSEASYKNSIQALGYSIILDSITHGSDARSVYYVLYCIYKSSKQEYEWMMFPKSRVQRVEFINDLIIDITKLEMYKEHGIYPRHGENCYNFFRECDYIEMCHTPIEIIAENYKKKDTSAYGVIQEYDFEYTLEEIKQHQLQAIEDTIVATDGTMKNQ
jgi:hypothetical protein